MLMNLHKTKWTSGLTLKKFEDVQEENEKTVEKMLKLSKVSYTSLTLGGSLLARIPTNAAPSAARFFSCLFARLTHTPPPQDYNDRVVAEEGKTVEELIVESAGKVDPKKHLGDKVEELMSGNILQCLGTMLDTVVF